MLLEQADARESGKYLNPPKSVSTLDIVFVGFEDGRPKWKVTRFFAKKVKGEIVVEPEREDRGSFEKTTIFNGAGLWGPAAAFVKENIRGFYSSPAVTLTGGLEKAADAVQRKTVGGPYSILLIDAKGHHWVQLGECRGD